METPLVTLRTLLPALALLAAPALAQEPFTGAHGLSLPATFTGTLPCADCEGIEHHLDLFPDQTYQMRREWLGRESPLVRDELGRWHADPAREAVVLTGAAEAPIFWEVKAPDRVRLMDLDGNPIVSDLPYELTGGPLSETDLSLFMGGMVTYMADAAIFQECITGRTFPVAIEGAWIDLERAYLGTVEGGTPLYATLEGTISMRPAMEGPDRRTVTVDRFVGVYPGQTCARARANASLVNTFWKITDLAGTPVAPAEGNREPFLVLRADSFNATVGCNMMRGGYEAGDGTLAFGPAASTMMACPEPLDGWERSLAETLGATASYTIAGDTLVLMEEAGDTLATFRAVYLP
jgi:copper homeostasis protein (lipoprotein)